MGFGFAFDLFSILFPLMFILVFGMILVTLAKVVAQWNKNNHSPRLTVPATVVSKRAHRNHNTGVNHTHTSTSYYVTFEVESGDRMELHMSGSEFGLLVEGDRGLLSFQGTRYLGFERKIV